MADKPLNKIIRETKGNKKFKVFVKDGDKIKTVRFGDANVSIKRDDPKRRKAFFDRMKPILANVKCLMFQGDPNLTQLKEAIFP